MERKKLTEADQDQAEEPSCSTEPKTDGNVGGKPGHESCEQMNSKALDGDAVEEKRRRLESSGGYVVENCQEVEANSEDGESWTEKALRNQLILRQIFSHLPTNVVLRSCSLVNKTWNVEARKFLRDHRECTVEYKYYDKSSICSFLINFQQLCWNIKGSGREIPMNSLRIHGPYCSRQKCKPNNSERNASTSVDLPTEFKLKYLDIGRCECDLHQPFEKLLHHSRPELRTLDISHLLLLRKILSKQTSIKFTNLEELSIGSRVIWKEERFADQKKLVHRLIRSAPKLKRILVRDTKTMTLVPQKLQDLVEPADEFEFRLTQNEHIGLLCQISENSARLKDFTVYQPVTNELLENSDEEEDAEDLHEDMPVDEPVDADLHRKFDRALEKTLQNCHGGLEKLCIKGAYPFHELSCPPLSSLVKLRIEKRFPGKLEQLWNLVTSLDFDRVTPRRKEMEIVVCSRFWSDAVDKYVKDTDFQYEWPSEEYEVFPLYSSRTVRRLTLGIETWKINIRPLQTLFPHITVLELIFSHKCKPDPDQMPFGKIWAYWPHLQKLQIHGEDTRVHHNFDADFCGINEEEATWLRSQRTKFLQKLQIVPIKPCILTMQSLRKVEMNLGWYGEEPSWSGYGSDGNCVQFLSKVTRIIALERMPQLKFVAPHIHKVLCSCSSDYEDRDGN